MMFFCLLDQIIHPMKMNGVRLAVRKNLLIDTIKSWKLLQDVAIVTHMDNILRNSNPFIEDNIMQN